MDYGTTGQLAGRAWQLMRAMYGSASHDPPPPVVVPLLRAHLPAIARGIGYCMIVVIFMVCVEHAHCAKF